jgi:anti-sigma B factor antagonist
VASLDNFPIKWAGPLAIVTLPAEIDISNADQIEDTLLAVLNRDVATLVIDMTRTTFCGCAGASAVARAHRRATANRAQVRVAARARIVHRIFAITGVDRLVPLYDSVDAAVSAGPAAAVRAPAGAARTASPGLRAHPGAGPGSDGASGSGMGAAGDAHPPRWSPHRARRRGA